MRTGNIPSRKLAQERRQREAAERQAAYDALSDAEKAKVNPKRYASDD